MGMKIKYKVISHLYGNHKVRGCDRIQKVAEIGMGLRRGTHFQEGEFHKTTTCLAHWIPTSGQHPNTVTEVLQKGCYINPNPEREGNEKELMFADGTFCQEQSTVPGALGTASHFILVTILIR